MNLRKAKEFNLKLLKEYSNNKDSFLTSFSGKNLVKSGKKADNIATGESKPYKNNTYITAYERKLPNLGRLTQKLKKEKPVSAIQLVGPALEELLVLVKSFRLRKDEKGLYKLPFGDNIRLNKIGNTYLISYQGDKEKSDIIKQD